jgi:hypothetical protein
MRTFFILISLVLAGLFAMGDAPDVFAKKKKAAKYEEAAVENGATLTGKVTFKGTVPPPKKFELAKFAQQEFCGQISDGNGNRDLVMVRTGADGGLGDVVVSIEDVEAGKPFPSGSTDVKIETCQFFVENGPSNMVGVVRSKTDFNVTNGDADPSDPKTAEGVLHNPHGFDVKGSQRITVFNIGLPTKGGKMNQDLKRLKGESLHLVCDQHEYMQNFFKTVENPYYAVVNPDGTFSIDQIPPGTYEVSVWHPLLGEKEMEITFEAGKSVTQNFEFTG